MLTSAYWSYLSAVPVKLRCDTLTLKLLEKEQKARNLIYSNSALDATVLQSFNLPPHLTHLITRKTWSCAGQCASVTAVEVVCNIICIQSFQSSSAVLTQSRGWQRHITVTPYPSLILLTSWALNLIVDLRIDFSPGLPSAVMWLQTTEKWHVPL